MQKRCLLLIVCLIFLFVGCSRWHIPYINPRITPVSYYEGKKPKFVSWFYRVVPPGKNVGFIINYGIYKVEGKGGRTESYIQFINEKTGELLHQNFPVTGIPDPDQMARIEVGRNWATKYNLGGEMIMPGGKLIWWRLKQKKIVSWRDNLFDDKSMGFAMLDPRVDSYWTSRALYSTLEGKLVWGDDEINFDGGVGFTEVRWGERPPRNRVFIQGINFDGKSGVILINAAEYKKYKMSRWIYNIAMQVGEDFHQFRSIDFNKITGDFEEGKWIFNVKGLMERLIIEVTFDPDNLKTMPTPTPAGLARVTQYSTNARVEVKVQTKRTSFWQMGDMLVCPRAVVEMSGELFKEIPQTAIQVPEVTAPEQEAEPAAEPEATPADKSTPGVTPIIVEDTSHPAASSPKTNLEPPDSEAKPESESPSTEVTEPSEPADGGEPTSEDLEPVMF